MDLCSRNSRSLQPKLSRRRYAGVPYSLQNNTVFSRAQDYVDFILEMLVMFILLQACFILLMTYVDVKYTGEDNGYIMQLTFTICIHVHNLRKTKQKN